VHDSPRGELVIGSTRVPALAMFHIEKPKLPKGLGYPLKTSLLQGALREVHVTCDVLLRYWTPQTGTSVFEAEYWLPNENRPATLFVRAGSLRQPDVNPARAQLETVVLPEFGTWFARVLNLPEGSTLLSRNLRFDARYEAGVLLVEKTRV
jgi:hypothetical protein